MAKGSSVLRNIFGFFNLLFAIVAVIVIVLTILIHVNLSNVHEFEQIGGVILLYVIGFITLAISFLGAYGAFREVKWMLVFFLVLMCIGFLYLVRFAIVMAIVHPEVSDMAEEKLKAIELSSTSEDFQRVMDGFQNSMQCCGLFNGYHDWKGNVPESCNCFAEDTMANVCVTLPGYSQVYFFQQERALRMVYGQSCGPLLLTLLKKGFDGVMGVFIGLTALTVFGIVLSACLIAQINRNRSTGAVFIPPSFVPPLVFSTTKKYTELVNDVPHH